jgi:hypothetical protein
MFWGLPDPHPDLFVRGTDPRIRISTKISRIHKTANKFSKVLAKIIHIFGSKDRAGLGSGLVGLDADPDPEKRCQSNWIHSISVRQCCGSMKF